MDLTFHQPPSTALGYFRKSKGQGKGASPLLYLIQCEKLQFHSHRPQTERTMASARLLLLSAALLFHYFAACAPLPSRDSCLDVSPAERQRCDVSSIRVRQTNRGRRRGGATMDPVFEVEVENGCCCAVSRVVLVSEGFASSVPVDPRLFRREEGGGGYLVADGREIPSSGSLTFRYAWDRAFCMYPASLESNCSALAKQREAISVDEN